MKVTIQQQSMTQQGSELSEASQLTLKIENCLLKSLKSTQTLIDEQTLTNLRHKIQELSQNDCLVETIQYFIYALINQVQRYQHVKNSDGGENEDYENLETAVQKAEAEIRKHIRLEQQLKIYMDGLEEKIQQLEKQLKIQSQKYHQLFESMKIVDMEKRQLKKRLKEYQQKTVSLEKQPRHMSHKTSKILSEPSMYNQVGYPYKLYNDRARIPKNKNYLQKSLHYRQIPEKKGLQDEINVSLKHSPSTKKRNQTQKTQIKQMTRTIQLQQNFRKQSRKLLKYSTQQKYGMGVKRGDARCNSVCH